MLNRRHMLTTTRNRFKALAVPSRNHRASAALHLFATLAVAGVLLASASVTSAAVLPEVPLDKATQGEGNKGISYRPLDPLGNPAAFVLTARSDIDTAQPFTATAPGQGGTVYIGKDGAGVQNASAGGSKGISGGGGDADEELIFTYDAPVLLGDIRVFLADIEFGKGLNDKDDPIIFLSLAGSGIYGVTALEAAVFGAFTDTGGKTGWVDFGTLTALSNTTPIDAFKIRETNDHIYVTGVTPVPEPAICSLMLAGGLTLLARRRRTQA